MNRRSRSRMSVRQRSTALALFVLLQSLATVFFVADAWRDLFNAPTDPHTFLEALVVLMLILGVLLGGRQLRLALEQMQEQERALITARGELSRVIEAQFDEWGLTPAERDVGFLALKGLDVAEIATMRDAAQGTVRAQLTRIYAKAGVSGRAQFASWFVEDLLDGTST